MEKVSNTTTIKAILQKHITKPACSFKRIKQDQQFDRVIKEIEEWLATQEVK